jgi:hypothetical protein
MQHCRESAAPQSTTLYMGRVPENARSWCAALTNHGSMAMSAEIASSRPAAIGAAQVGAAMAGGIGLTTAPAHPDGAAWRGCRGVWAVGTCHRPSQDATVEPVAVRALRVSHGTRHVSRPCAHMSYMKYEKGGDGYHKRRGKGSKKYCEKLYNRARTFQ